MTLPLDKVSQKTEKAEKSVLRISAIYLATVPQYVSNP